MDAIKALGITLAIVVVISVGFILSYLIVPIAIVCLIFILVHAYISSDTEYREDDYTF